MASGGTKRVKILKGKGEIGWTVTKRLDHGSLSAGDLRVLVGKGSMEQIARDLPANLPPGSLAGNAPPEAQLQYPDSSLVVDSIESHSSTAGDSP
jgi:hypothetical protein